MWTICLPNVSEYQTSNSKTVFVYDWSVMILVLVQHTGEQEPEVVYSGQLFKDIQVRKVVIYIYSLSSLVTFQDASF